MTNPETAAAARRFRIATAKAEAGKACDADNDYTAGLLDSVRKPTMGGRPIADAFECAVRTSCYSETTRACVALATATVQTLAGSLGAFDRLDAIRKGRVLAAAVAVHGTFAGYESTWGPECSAIGPAVWQEVAAA